MSTSTSAPRRPPTRSAGGGGDDFRGGDEGGGGGGGGGDDLVKVAFARTQAEGEMLQGLLSEAGIPSVLNRAQGFYSVSYVPGPVDVMVAARMAKRAREVLAETMLEDENEELAELEEQRRLARGEGTGPAPARLALWICAFALFAFILVWVLYQAS
ncbi:MAG: putative signal transducing protein [Solirubrobacterales bacterium]